MIWAGLGEGRGGGRERCCGGEHMECEERAEEGEWRGGGEEGSCCILSIVIYLIPVPPTNSFLYKTLSAAAAPRPPPLHARRHRPGRVEDARHRAPSSTFTPARTSAPLELPHCLHGRPMRRSPLAKQDCMNICSIFSYRVESRF